MAITAETEHGRYVIARVQAERAGRTVQIAAVLGAAACIGLAALLQAPINRQRRDLQLVSHSDVYKDLPPVYGLVGAAGGPLRAITSMYLWMRSEKLKEDGKYYESDNLARWICTLQPRFPTVWANRAWDLSYNISVGTQTRRERWQWVYNGIRLLRDEGIPNNDRFAGLYQQLAWIWFHKVGDRLDDYHHFYKRQWAADMEILLGAPPTGLSDEQTIDWFRPVAEAPRTLEGLIAERPGVAKLVQSLDRLGVDVNAETNNNRIFHPLEETFFRPYTAWLDAQTYVALRSKTQEPEPEEEGLDQFFQNAPEEDFDALVAYLRAKVLREQYKMDPQYMLDLTGKLETAKPIPIDWRTPYSQAIYWSMYGVAKAKELKTVREFDLINTDRVLLFSLSKLRESGRYTFRLDLDQPMDSYLAMAPDFRYLEAMHGMYLKMGVLHPDEGDAKIKGGTTDVLKTGHINFLRDSVVDLWLAGHETEARKWFDYLRTTYKDEYTKQTQRDYVQGLEAFVMSQVKDRADIHNGAMTMVHSLLAGAYESLAAGYVDEYSAKIRNALKVYNMYQGDKMDDPGGRRTLDPFVNVRADALVSFIVNVRAGRPANHPLIYSIWAWQREQDDVKRQCYDFLKPAFEKLAALENLDPAKAFPAPAGMDQWRKEHPSLNQPEDIVKQRQEQKKAEQK